SPPIAPGNNQAALWTGYINIPANNGVPIDIATFSDDGSRVWIDGTGANNLTGATLLVDNFFNQSFYRHSGPVTLKPGLHTIAIAFYNGSGYVFMNLTW